MLTREQILNATPAQINEWIDDYIMNDRDKFLPPENWTRDISAAWEVADKLKIAIIPQSTSAPPDLKYLARAEWDYRHKEIDVFAKSAPEAICKAALLTTIQE